jgi:hypothetical protein
MMLVEVSVGYDVSFHPVDVELIRTRLIPFIRGEGDIDDLVQRAVRLAKVRFRANAWGLGALDCGKGEEKTAAMAIPDHFDSHLHVWGRPFFITDESPEDVSSSIDLYLAASPREVDGIARSMLHKLKPGLEKHVQPSTGGKLPSDNNLNRGLRARMEFLRAAYAALQRGETIEMNDEEVDAADALAGNVPLLVLDFAANFQPGWMARGYVWPTHLLSEAGLESDVEDLFGAPAYFLEPLSKEVKGLNYLDLEPTITSNYTVGGYVSPADVPKLRALLEDHRDRILEANEGCENDLRKIVEAVHDAQRRGMGFAEAAEIYSGIMGIMN